MIRTMNKYAGPLILWVGGLFAAPVAGQDVEIRDLSGDSVRVVMTWGWVDGFSDYEFDIRCDSVSYDAVDPPWGGSSTRWQCAGGHVEDSVTYVDLERPDAGADLHVGGRVRGIEHEGGVERVITEWSYATAISIGPKAVPGPPFVTLEEAEAPVDTIRPPPADTLPPDTLPPEPIPPDPGDITLRTAWDDDYELVARLSGWAQPSNPRMVSRDGMLCVEWDGPYQEWGILRFWISGPYVSETNRENAWEWSSGQPPELTTHASVQWTRHHRERYHPWTRPHNCAFVET